MRQFVYFSSKAPTSGKFDTDNLMKAGRMDIAIHTLISSFFLSHDVRKDVKLHLVFYGMPDPPKHIEIIVTPELKLSKKDVGKIIKKVLYKYKEGKKNEALPGCFIEKKSLYKVLEELEEEGNQILILDKKGENVRDIQLKEDCVFVLGDHEGMPKKELKRIKQTAQSVSVGPKMYFASQVVAIVNNELDLRGF